MTVVGYDDRLWVDLNSNGLVDDGEKGAFKVANSWGSGWRQNGFAWFAYDALKAVSAVSGAPADGRVEGWWDRTAYWMTAKAEYAPKLTAEFTLNHAKRNQLYVTLGVSNTNQTSPTSTWEPPAFFYRGGAHAFDGGASAVDGVFVLDFTDIAPPPATAKRFHVGVYDDGSGESAVLKTYKLTDVYGGGTEKNAVNVPQTVENGQIYAWVDHNRSTPDLTVLSLTHSPEYPSPGSLVTFTATIWNKGTVIAPACRVGFWSYLLGEPLLTTTPEIEKSVPAIAAGLTAEVTFSLTAPAAGSRRAWVFVDRKQGVGEVEESNETNNAGPSGGHPWGVNGAPVISSGPTVSPNPVSVGRMASFSVVANDPENGILTGVWNFGDGQTDSGLAVEHAYANAGTYAAQVTVSDDKGAATQGSVLVIVTTNTAPVLLAPPTATPPQAWREQTILFSAAATDAENDPLTFAWDFGDGNSAVGASVEHRYANGGTYVVSVVVSDPSNAFDRKELTVIVGDNAPPQITLGPQATPQPTGVGGELSFWVQATDPDGGAVTITWDFGDGATALGSAVKHAYSVAGAYVVTVRVADAGGAEIASTLSVEILANWDAPSLVSAPTARPNPVKPGAPVLFSATTNAPGTTYAAWDFGDGSSAPGVCAVHSFTQTGVYVVKFLAADDQGRQTFASLCVAVENSDDAGESETAKATKTQLKVGFAKKGRDAVSISGVINIPKNFSPAGLTADVSLGDVERSFILDAKGRGAVGRNDKFQISFKSVKKVIQPGPAKFSLSLKNGDFRSAWEKWGLADADVSKRILRLPLLLQAGELSYVGTIDVTYSAKAGKAGSGR
jgi:chitodextrinase